MPKISIVVSRYRSVTVSNCVEHPGLSFRTPLILLTLIFGDYCLSIWPVFPPVFSFPPVPFSRPPRRDAFLPLISSPLAGAVPSCLSCLLYLGLLTPLLFHYSPLFFPPCLVLLSLSGGFRPLFGLSLFRSNSARRRFSSSARIFFLLSSLCLFFSLAFRCFLLLTFRSLPFVRVSSGHFLYDRQR